MHASQVLPKFIGALSTVTVFIDDDDDDHSNNNDDDDDDDKEVKIKYMYSVTKTTHWHRHFKQWVNVRVADPNAWNQLPRDVNTTLLRNKLLSYGRKTALQGGLVLAKSGRLERENISPTL